MDELDERDRTLCGCMGLGWGAGLVLKYLVRGDFFFHEDYIS